MKKYLMLLLISILSLGLLSCGQSKSKTSKEKCWQKADTVNVKLPQPNR